MDNERLIHILAVQARNEPPPSVDVADRVMTALAEGAGERRATIDRPLAWVAACSAVAAIVLALIGFAAFETLLDPLVDNFNSLTWVTP